MRQPCSKARLEPAAPFESSAVEHDSSEAPLNHPCRWRVPVTLSPGNSREAVTRGRVVELTELRVVLAQGTPNMQLLSVRFSAATTFLSDPLLIAVTALTGRLRLLNNLPLVPAMLHAVLQVRLD